MTGVSRDLPGSGMKSPGLPWGEETGLPANSRRVHPIYQASLTLLVAAYGSDISRCAVADTLRTLTAPAGTKSKISVENERPETLHSEGVAHIRKLAV